MEYQEADRKGVLNLLRGVLDIHRKRDIVSLGMVKGVVIKDGTVFVNLEVDSREESVRQGLRSEIEKVLEGQPGIQRVIVEILSPAPGKGVFAQQQPIPGIRHTIAVASGKGGVGKTTVAVNLAIALAGGGYKIGLMDADIYGPNVPLMLGIHPEARPLAGSGDKLLPLEAQGLKMISMGVLVPSDQPMVWRGPMLHSAVTQFLKQVEWGDLDFLLVDLPPGTGDVQLSLVQSVPLSGAVIVTTPQEVALTDVRKGIAMFRKTHVPILGVIENMAGEIFGEGGGERAARETGVPFLGRIPLERRVRECGDRGTPIAAECADDPVPSGIRDLSRRMMQSLSQMTAKV